MFSIRQKLLLLQCGTVFATTLLLGGLSYYLFIPTVFNLQQQQLQQVSREAAKDLQTHLHNLTHTIEMLDLEEFHGKYGDLPIEELFVRNFKRLSGTFPLISYLDEQGNETIRLVNSRPSEHFYNHQQVPVVLAANAEPNKIHIQIQARSPGFDHPSLQLAITKIAYFGDEFLGTLLLTLPLSDLSPHFNAIPLAKNSFFSLVDQQQRLVLTADENDQFATVPAPLPEAPARFELFGQDLFIATAPVEPVGWQVIAAIPYADFIREATNLKWIAALTLTLVTLLSGLLALLLTRHLTRNISLLVQQTKQVGAGDLEQQLDLYQDKEFTQLGESFNAMTQDLARQRASSESLQQILQSIIDPLVVTDRQGKISQVNHALLELFACEEKQLIGRPVAELFTSSEPSGQDNFAEGLLRKRIANLETTITTHGGNQVAVLFSSCPVPGSSAEIGVVGIIKDIDELAAARRAREMALTAAEEAHRKLDALLKSVADGLVVTNLSGKILLQNQPAEKLLGDQHLEIFKEALSCLPHPLQSGSVEPFDINLPATDDAKLRIIQIHSSPVLNQQGEQTGVVSVLRDVTRERALEQIKTEFISTAAHELVTPLTSILGYSELLLDRELETNFSADQKRDFMEEILGRSESLSKIVDDLLNISRIESGQPIPLAIKAIDLEPLLRKTVAQFQLVAPRHNYDISLTETTGCLILADQDKLQQVIDNLLSNAVKYSPEPGDIRIRSKLVADSYQLEICDQGIGMSDEEVVRVFDKFYRADSSNTSIGGLGIGMSIVQQIIQGHQGDIRIESTLGQGTCVTLRLPLAQAESKS